jgi:hypothetical protein
MYILLTLLHVSTSLGHLQVTLFFQGIYRTAHNVTRTLKYVVVFVVALYTEVGTTNNDDSMQEDAEV